MPILMDEIPLEETGPRFLDTAPMVPLDYFRNEQGLSEVEIHQARVWGYISPPIGNLYLGDAENLRFDPFKRDGSIEYWRNRMFLIWFCYLYENSVELGWPLGPIGFLLAEFQGGPDVFYESGFKEYDFTQFYVSSGSEPSYETLGAEQSRLEPNYQWAQKILADLKY